MFKGIWIDGSTKMPDYLANDNWTHARSAHEALLKLEILEFEYLDIDISLRSTYGSCCITGKDVLDWLGERKARGLVVPKHVLIHGEEQRVSSK